MARYKIERVRHKTGKPGMVQLMLDLGVVQDRREASRAYDAMTAALHAWLVTGTKDCPPGLHLTLNLRDAMTMHIAWCRSRTGQWPDRLNYWTSLTADARYHIRRANPKRPHRDGTVARMPAKAPESLQDGRSGNQAGNGTHPLAETQAMSLDHMDIDHASADWQAPGGTRQPQDIDHMDKGI